MIQPRRPTDRLSAAIDLFKTASLHSYKICSKATSTPVSHFTCPLLAHECIFNHVTLLSTTWCCSCQLCHCVCALLYSARAYLTGRCSRAACGVHSPEGRYVLSTVLHAPEEGSQRFSTLVPSCFMGDMQSCQIASLYFTWAVSASPSFPPPH